MFMDNILLIEDSPSQAKHLQLLLQQLGYAVRLASDGKEGWCTACTTHPTLILLDMNLPTLNGLQVLARLKRDTKTANIPVVILSDSDSIVQVEKAIELGASDYLFKGDCLRWDASTQLANAITQVLHAA
jgi:DNA-binding response OmpR family regulator